MILDFKKIIDKHKDDICIIVGSGPTMNEFDYEKFKGQIILVGGAILRINKNVKPDYLISCNSHFPIVDIKSHMDLISSFKNNPTWILSDTCAHSDLWNFDIKKYEKLKINCSFFDDRHYNFKKCKQKSKCCDFLNIYPKRKTLMEIVEEKYSNKFNYYEKTGSSVIDSAFMIATLMGFKTILIQGVDLPDKFYQGKITGKEYFGVKNLEADKFEDEQINKIIQKKYFYFYFKNLNFKPYLKSFISKMGKIFSKKSLFSEKLHVTLKIFEWLCNICRVNDRQVFYLSKNSNLKKVKNIKFITDVELKNKYNDKFE